MRTSRLPFTPLLLAAIGAACGGSAEGRNSGEPQSSVATAGARPSDCPPLETREPNAPSQRPAFEEQTRACGVKSDVAFDVVVVAKGLEHPWGLQFLPDGRLLVTERGGTMRLVTKDGKLSKPIAGVPEVAAVGQGGLLDVLLAPDFAETGTIYFSYGEPREGGANGTSVARAKLADTDDETKALEAEAAKAVAERRVVAVYPMEVALNDGVPVATSVRERIRASHRTTLTKDWYDVPL